MTITLKELADFCGARLEGGDELAVIHSAADITAAESGQVTQLTNSRYSHHLKNSTASACIIVENFPVTDFPESEA